MYIAPEKIAKRYAIREGCRLVDYKEVAFQLFELNLRVLAIESRDISPVVEFLLKFIKQGANSIDLLAGLIGLDELFIRSQLVDMRRDELVDLLPESTDDSLFFALTERGEYEVMNLTRSVTQEIQYPSVFYHGLLRKPVAVGRNHPSYYKLNELEQNEIIPIRAVPKRAPDNHEIDSELLSRLHQENSAKNRRQANLELIAVKSILKPVQSRLYQHAVMLEYETTDSRRAKQVSFAIEGEVKKEYEQAFYNVGGIEKFPQLFSEHVDTIQERLEKTISLEGLEALGDYGNPEEDANRVDYLEQQIEDKSHEMKASRHQDTKAMQKAEIENLKKMLVAQQQSNREKPVQLLKTEQIREKFLEAIKICQDRLLILSGFLGSAVDNEFKNLLSKALERGVRVWIGYGMDPKDDHDWGGRNGRAWIEAEKILSSLKEKYPKQLDCRDLGQQGTPSHEKRLICDNKFTVGGSFNFLSFKAERRGRRQQRREGGELIICEATIEEFYKMYLDELFR